MNCPHCLQPMPEAPGTWPSWDQFVAFLKSSPKGTGARCRMLNAIEAFRKDNPEATVENAIAWGSLRSYRNIGKATMNYAMDRLIAWRDSWTRGGA